MEGGEWELLCAGGAVLLFTLALGVLTFWLERCRDEVSSADLFFTGNRQLRSPPMTLSLIITLVSPLSWLALPSVVALQGLAPAVTAILGLLLSAPLTAVLFLPVFFHVQPTTAFEYLEQRFSRSVNLLASGLFICYTITSLPAMLYVPVAVLQKVTKVEFLYAGPIVLVIALAYTALGGMRVIQWAGSVHILLAVASLSSILVLGSSHHTWQKIAERAPQLLSMQKGWAAGLGTAFWAGAQLACGQPQVQRYLSVPLLEQSKMSVALAAVGVSVLGVMLTAAGLLMATQDISSSYLLIASDEHSLSHYVPFAEFCFSTVKDVPGLSGLIVAALFSLALSSLSSGVHALAAVLTMDLRLGGSKSKWHEVKVSRGRWAITATSLVILLASALMVLVPEPLLSVALTFPRVTSGTIFGLFCLGMFIPWANTAGALTGGVLSLVGVWWASLGGSVLQFSRRNDNITTTITNATMSHVTMQQHALLGASLVPPGCLAPLGCALTVVIGSVVSGLACPHDPRDLDPDLVSPLTRWLHRKIRGISIGANYEDSSIQEDFRYESVSTQDVRVPRRTGGPYARGGARLHTQRRRRAEIQQQLQQQQEWPDIAYPSHLSRQRAQRPLSGLAWDQATGELYLVPPPSDI